MKWRVTGFCLFLVCVVLVGSSWGYTAITFYASGTDGSNTADATSDFTYNDSFFGFHAGAQTQNGSNDNSFFGAYAGRNNTGSFNSFFGSGAGNSNTTGFYNSFVGYNAGNGNIGGYKNSFNGFEAGYKNTEGIENSFFGSGAGLNNVKGRSNSFFGNNAGLNNNQAGVVNTGDYSSFFGNQAGFYNTTGSNNNFFGHDAGFNNNTGSDNSFFGELAGVSNTAGNYNTFFGNYSGYFNTVGSGNVFLGYGAGYNETGSNKLYIDNCLATGAPCTSPLIKGDFSAQTLTVNGALTATSFTGNGSGLTNVNGTAVTGTVANATNATSATNATTVTNGVYTTGGYANPAWITSLAGSKITGLVDKIGSNTTNYIPRWNGTQLVSGIISDNGSAAAVNGTLTVASLVSVSDERYKRNIQPLQLSLDKVTHLTGVSYEWKTEEYGGRGFKEGRQIGLIAQDVEKVFPELVQTDANGYKAVAYDKLVPVLIEAVKEQQKSIASQKNEIGDLNEKLSKTLKMMEQRFTALESPAKTVALK